VQTKRVTVTSLALLMAFQLAAPIGFSDASRRTVIEHGVSPGEVRRVMVPKEIERIPDRYFDKSDQPGTLTDLYYRTYESFSYKKASKPIRKHAVVYLPYGYTKDRQYDVFYLMHGGWGDETRTLGTPQRPSSFKNVIDHAVAAGEMRPLIIVCPTYNNTNANGLDSGNFSLAMKLTEN
jgi:hypothetical protein